MRQKPFALVKRRGPLNRRSFRERARVVKGLHSSCNGFGRASSTLVVHIRFDSTNHWFTLLFGFLCTWDATCGLCFLGPPRLLCKQAHCQSSSLRVSDVPQMPQEVVAHDPLRRRGVSNYERKPERPRRPENKCKASISRRHRTDACCIVPLPVRGLNGRAPGEWGICRRVLFSGCSQAGAGIKARS